MGKNILAIAAATLIAGSALGADSAPEEPRNVGVSSLGNLVMVGLDVARSGEVAAAAREDDPAASAALPYSDAPCCLFLDAQLARGNWPGVLDLLRGRSESSPISGLDIDRETLREHAIHRIPSTIEFLIRSRLIPEARKLIDVYKSFDPALAFEESFLDRVDNALTETLTDMAKQAAKMGDETLKAKAYSLADLFTSRKFNIFLRGEIDKAYVLNAKALPDRDSSEGYISKDEYMSLVRQLAEKSAAYDKAQSELDMMKTETSKLDRLNEQVSMMSDKFVFGSGAMVDRALYDGVCRQLEEKSTELDRMQIELDRVRSDTDRWEKLSEQVAKLSEPMHSGGFMDSSLPESLNRQLEEKSLALERAHSDLDALRAELAKLDRIGERVETIVDQLPSLSRVESRIEDLIREMGGSRGGTLTAIESGVMHLVRAEEKRAAAEEADEARRLEISRILRVKDERYISRSSYFGDYGNGALMIEKNCKIINFRDGEKLYMSSCGLILEVDSVSDGGRTRYELSLKGVWK